MLYLVVLRKVIDPHQQHQNLIKKSLLENHLFPWLPGIVNIHSRVRKLSCARMDRHIDTEYSTYSNFSTYRHTGSQLYEKQESQ